MFCDFFWIDAFTDSAFAGNPCAVFYRETGFSDDGFMRNMAREMNLSETAFVWGNQQSGFSARYFTPQREIPLAGHPTLSVARALYELNLLDLRHEKAAFELSLKAGKVKVEVHHRKTEIFVSMLQLPPEFFDELAPEKVCVAAGLTIHQVMDGFKPQIVSTGTPFLLLPVKSEKDLHNVSLNQSVLMDLSRKHDFFSLHVFCWDPDKEMTHARHIGFGEEDPFTGSATGCMGAWLFNHNLIKANQSYKALQGSYIGREGEAAFEVLANSERCDGVMVSGFTKLLLRGKSAI